MKQDWKKGNESYISVKKEKLENCLILLIHIL